MGFELSHLLKIQAEPTTESVDATLEPCHSCTTVGASIWQATNSVMSPCHSADLLCCSAQVGPWASLSLSPAQVQSDSLQEHFSSKPSDHCQMRAILRGTVNLRPSAQGTFLWSCSVGALWNNSTALRSLW